MNAPKTIIPFPRQTARRRAEELAFLPAALEIVERPPSPTGRALMITIILLAVGAIVWASLGSIDIIATAPGKIIPTGRSKIIQPLEIGVIRTIAVKDGQEVKAGDLLVELDPTINGADRDHAQGDLYSAELDVARLKAILADTANSTAEFHPPAGVDPKLVASQRRYMLDEIAEQQAKLVSLDHQRAQKDAERGTAKASIGKIEALLPLLQQQLDIRKILFEHQTGSKLLYLQSLQSLVEQQQDLSVAKSRYRETDAALSAIIVQREQTAKEFTRARLDELTKAETKVAGLTQDLIRTGERTKLQRLVAPEDGVVQQLAVHTVGGIVTPAEALLVLVPKDSHLEIQAKVSNTDVGFVRPGQVADIKVDTFPYTRYGLLRGVVQTISADAVTADDRPDKASQKTAAAAADAEDANAKAPVFEAHISLDKTSMQIEDATVALSPGMAVTVEMKTGSRRIISYLLSPLLRYGHESLRER